MADYHQDPCYCSLQGRRTVAGGAIFDHNHCHYEHRRQESRGPLYRTSSSSTLDCHQHHPSSHDSSCPGRRRRSRCSDSRRSHRSRSIVRQEDSPDVARALEEILDQRSRDSELSRLLDELRHQRHHEDSDSTRVIGDIVSRLLDRNGLETSYRPLPTTNRNTLIDLILRSTSNSNSGAPVANSVRGHSPGLYPRHTLSGIDLMSIQAPWVAHESMPVSVGMWPMDMGVAIPRPIMYAVPDHARPVPHWTGGVWH